jgi:hypothetical protein
MSATGSSVMPPKAPTIRRKQSWTDVNAQLFVFQRPHRIYS